MLQDFVTVHTTDWLADTVIINRMEGAEENGHTMFRPCKSLVMERKKNRKKK